MASETKSISAPKWDSKQATAGRYMAQVEATAVYYDCGDAIEASTVIPTKTVYDGIAETATDV